MIKRLLARLEESRSFGMDFLSMATGSVLILAIQIVLTPFLSRIYLPAEYGTFSIYSALITTMVIVSTMGLKHAIMLPQNSLVFLNLIRLNLLGILGTTLMMTIILLFMSGYIIKWLQVPEVGISIYFFPLIAAVTSVGELMASWYIRSGDFKTGPTTRVISNLFSRSAAIAYGIWVSKLWWGLFVGDFVSRVFTMIVLSRKRFVRFLILLAKGINPAKLKAAAKGSRNFLLYNFPSNLFGNLSGQMPVYLAGVYFGVEIVGYLGFAIGLLYIPVNIIGNSVYTVFYQRAAKLGRDNLPELKTLTFRTFNNISFISVIPFAIVIGYGDFIFSWFLGENWVETGIIARQLGFLYLTFLLYLSVSSIFLVLDCQRYLLWVHLSSLLIIIATFTTGYLLNDPKLTFQSYGLIGTVPYLCALFLAFKKLNLSYHRLLLNLLIIIVLILVVVASRNLLIP